MGILVVFFWGISGCFFYFLVKLLDFSACISWLLVHLIFQIFKRSHLGNFWIEKSLLCDWTSWVLNNPPGSPACQRKRAGPLTLGWSPGFVARVWGWGQGGGCPGRIEGEQDSRIQPDQGQHSLTPISGFEFWLCSQSVGGFILILIGLLSSDLQSGEAQGWWISYFTLYGLVWGIVLYKVYIVHCNQRLVLLLNLFTYGEHFRIRITLIKHSKRKTIKQESESDYTVHCIALYCIVSFVSKNYSTGGICCTGLNLPPRLVNVGPVGEYGCSNGCHASSSLWSNVSKVTFPI